jgi:hypothetical protein
MTTTPKFYAVTAFSQSRRCTEAEAYDVAEQWQAYGYAAVVIPAEWLTV